ncbi:hypothetical protein [Brevibacillus migulae]|uniref:hypothetical protein n=1 Tax=Brevibacillus migulae TaxID=1644114 RepID=UPI00142F9AF6|nr:hypothetical protein [Brevibacillus migulae]
MDAYRLDGKEVMWTEPIVSPSPAGDETWPCMKVDLEELEAHPLLLLHAVTLVDY